MHKWYVLEKKEPISGEICYVYAKGLEKPELMCYVGEGCFFQIFHPTYMTFDADEIIAWMDRPHAPLESEITDTTELPA